jgi:hypothetical protein
MTPGPMSGDGDFTPSQDFTLTPEKRERAVTPQKSDVVSPPIAGPQRWDELPPNFRRPESWE